MKCPKETGEGQELLEFSFGSLSAERTAALEGHARECRECAAWIAEQRKVSAMLDLWEAPDVSAGFDRRLYGRIEKDAPWWDALARPFRAGWMPRWVAAATAAGLLAAVGLWIERPGAPPAKPAPVVVLQADQAADALQEMQVMQEFSNLMHEEAEPRI